MGKGTTDLLCTFCSGTGLSKVKPLDSDEWRLNSLTLSLSRELHLPLCFLSSDPQIKASLSLSHLALQNANAMVPGAALCCTLTYIYARICILSVSYLYICLPFLCNYTVLDECFVFLSFFLFLVSQFIVIYYNE